MANQRLQVTDSSSCITELKLDRTGIEVIEAWTRVMVTGEMQTLIIVGDRFGTIGVQLNSAM